MADRVPLPRPFFVVATQNPSDFHGTYPLPEAQMDRFALRLSLGYPDEAHELEVLLARHESDPFETLQPVLDTAQMLALQNTPHAKCASMIRSANTLCVWSARRASDARLRLPVSTRGALSLYRCAQAKAFLEKRDYCVPDDARDLAVPVLSHRIALDSKARYGGTEPEIFLEELLEQIPLPR